MTELEVIDTAVKVGLGAAISGISTYLVTRLKSRDDLSRERLKRHHELLEKCAEQVELFTAVSLRFWAYTTDYLRNKKKGSIIPDSRREELKKSREELFSVFGELTSAESKMLLLGHKEAQRLLRAYGELVKEMRTNTSGSSEDQSEETMEMYRVQLLQARESFFEELSKIYRRET